MTKEQETVTEVEVKKNTVSKKKFAPTDLVKCVSITPGELFVSGKKSGNLYVFADLNYDMELEYRDLKFGVASKDKNIFLPRFIIQDADFLAEFPELEKLYGSLYTTKDLKDILKLSANQMEKAIEKLPVGAKDALKTIAVTMIDNKQLDSIQKIKILDKIFGTEMLLKASN